MEIFGGTGITIEKLKSIKPTNNVDGTTYKIEAWIKEAELICSLPIDTKVWIPYNKMEYGKLKEIVMQKFRFEGYSFCTPDTIDWWILEPYMNVEDSEGNIWFVYEYSFYKRMKCKVREALAIKQSKPKRKFISSKELAETKRKEAINNRNLK